MRIDCYLDQDCGSEEALRANINVALRLESVHAQVSFTRLKAAEAHELGIKGSPSVHVDGEDILPSGVSGSS